MSKKNLLINELIKNKVIRISTFTVELSLRSFSLGWRLTKKDLAVLLTCFIKRKNTKKLSLLSVIQILKTISFGLELLEIVWKNRLPFEGEARTYFQLLKMFRNKGIIWQCMTAIREAGGWDVYFYTLLRKKQGSLLVWHLRWVSHHITGA
jgi:hypothetical protein